ncbi:MAG: hypothetical protein ACXWM7_01145 [Parachlamydiaceae bacterium]
MNLLYSFLLLYLLAAASLATAMPFVPQRAERPSLANVSISTRLPRPICVAKPLPKSIDIHPRSTRYPFAALTPIGPLKNENFLSLDNGSHWKIRHRDLSTCKNWKKGDCILIEAGKFFSWSTYKLVNHTRHESIDAELYTPIREGSLAHWIIAIHPCEGSLQLQDHSTWKINSSDLAEWAVGDDVMIGITKNWFSNDYSYLLINPRTQNRLIVSSQHE